MRAASEPAASALFGHGRIGSLELANRFVRAGTSETMATDAGAVTDELVRLYEDLARGGVGLIFTGHLYCAQRGQYAPRQTGIYDDSLIPGLSRIADAVRVHGGRVFAQLAHAGSQTRVPAGTPLAPSSVPNALTGREVGEASEEEVEEALGSFAAAARRAVEAGFDGVHIHGANGYLISEFSSPLTNRREDDWGGSAEKRDRFALEVARRVRAAVPPELPVTMKLGMVDAVAGGLSLDESVARVGRLVRTGIDALEVSVNVMGLATDSVRQYVAVGPRRAARDLLLHRLFGTPADEAYFIPWARAVRPTVSLPLIVAGGMRRVDTMERILRAGDADFVALARPLIREPDLINRIARGSTTVAACTSCNICLMHEGRHSLRCWRSPRVRLAEHALYRLRGELRG